MMHSLRVLGLTWIVLWTAATVVAAQTTAASPPAPIRLPGIVYPAPADARAEPTAPALKPKGPTSRLHSAPSTPARARHVRADPLQPPRAGSLVIVNGRDIPVATMTVTTGTETVRHVEPLAPSAQATLKLPQMKGCVAKVEAMFEGGEISAIGDIDVCKVKLVRLVE